MALNPLGVLSYNGVTFDEKSNFDYEVRMVYDQADRTVVRNTYTLNVKGWITSGTDPSTDAKMDDRFLTLLTQPAGILVIEDKGAGTLRINDPATGDWDLAWGPKPRMIRFKPLGGGNAAEVIWSVEFCLPNCVDAANTVLPMEANYRVTVAIDQSGYSRRTYSGHVIVPVTRHDKDDRSIPDNADRMLEEVIPELPTGFRRGATQWTLTESKARIDFSVTDEEMPPNAPPPGIVVVDFDHQISSASAFPIIRVGTFVATYETQRGVDLLTAWRHFLAVAAARTALAVATKNCFQLWGPFSIKDSIYSRGKCSFTLSYTFLSAIKDIIGFSGLWKPVPQSDYAAWADSMLNGPSRTRGNAGLFFQNTDDAIIDLCVPEQVALPSTGTLLVDAFSDTEEDDLLENDLPDPDASWMDYLCTTELIQVDGTIEMKPLPNIDLSPGEPALEDGGTVELNSIPNPAGDGLSGEIGGAVSPALAAYGNITSVPNETIQTRTEPSFFYILRGRAIRAGYAINAPNLIGVGTAKAYPCNTEDNYFSTGQIANWGGIPIIGADWDLRWILDRKPDADVPIYDNPLSN